MKCATCFLILAALCGAAGAASPDIVLWDFEGEDYGGWVVTGEAFGAGPARGTLPGQMPVSGFLGEGLVNSFVGNDGTQGTLTSPAFRIARPWLSFLVGGGAFPGTTCMNLLVDGETVRTITGPNARPGGSEGLSWASWDVSDWMGREAVLQIVDARSDFWGHISIDHIVQSEESYVMPDLERFMTITEPFVFLPVKRGAAARRMDVFDGETKVRSFEVELADGVEDFWVGMTAGPLAGKRLRFQVAQPHGSSPHALDRLVQGAIPPDGGDLYAEAYRPRFHFSSMRGWNNDPNGLVYYDGEYHLFYQHNPYGWNWGNMTWGHAVSPDLVHWKELGDAIHPDELGTIFSGSAVVDTANTTGFKTGDEQPIVAVYTYAGGSSHWSEGQRFTQALAYSNDRGRTWAKYGGNPVQECLADGNRDPKAFWYEPGGHWVIVLFLDNGRMAFFSSPDLKSWKLESELDCGFHECPELFALPVDGDEDNQKWILYGGTGDYLIGAFDGTTFTPESEPVRYHYGTCFYASQTYNNIPADDGRRIQVAWGGVGREDMPFNQMMDFPVTLDLRSTPAGPRLFVQPVREIAGLYGRVHEWTGADVPDPGPLPEVAGDCYDIEAEFALADAEEVGLTIHGIPVVYNLAAHEIRSQGAAGPLPGTEDTLQIRILVDKLSMEIYGQHGQVYLPMQAHYGDAARGIAITGARPTRLVVRELESAWEH